MKKILIDVDDVICDNGFTDMLNDFLGTNYKIDDFTTYYIEEEVIKDQKQKLEFYNYIKDKNPYTNAKVFEGAVETIKQLNEKYDVYICSSCAIDIPGLKEASGLFFKNKYDFIINYLPFINCNKIILTGVKNMFEADIQIDDKLGHLKNNVKTKFMFTSYHNKNITDKELEECGVVRVNNWNDIAKHLL